MWTVIIPPPPPPPRLKDRQHGSESHTPSVNVLLQYLLFQILYYVGPSLVAFNFQLGRAKRLILMGQGSEVSSGWIKKLGSLSLWTSFSLSSDSQRLLCPVMYCSCLMPPPPTHNPSIRIKIDQMTFVKKYSKLKSYLYEKRCPMHTLATKRKRRRKH